MSVATIKEKILKTVEGFPSDTTIEDAMERLYLLYKIEKGIQQADNGQVFSHEEAKTRLKKWQD